MEQTTRTVDSSISVLKAGEIVRQRIATMGALANSGNFLREKDLRQMDHLLRLQRYVVLCCKMSFSSS